MQLRRLDQGVAVRYDYHAGVILCMHPANERWCKNATLSLIGWVHTQNDMEQLQMNKTRENFAF